MRLSDITANTDSSFYLSFSKFPLSLRHIYKVTSSSASTNFERHDQAVWGLNLQWLQASKFKKTASKYVTFSSFTSEMDLIYHGLHWSKEMNLS